MCIRGVRDSWMPLPISAARSFACGSAVEDGARDSLVAGVGFCRTTAIHVCNLATGRACAALLFSCRSRYSTAVARSVRELCTDQLV